MKFTYNFITKVNISQLNLCLLGPVKEQDLIPVIIYIYTNILHNFGFIIELSCSEYRVEHISVPRHFATSRKVAGSIPDSILRIFH